ncbi:MAG: deoxyribodipyrimidine photo-lyase [Hyphomicrobiaceae bacterium]
MTSIVWFRQDLRLHDNCALAHAAARGPVLPLYILDETVPPRGRPLGGAQRWWLHHSLAALEGSLGDVALLRGDPRELLPKVAGDAKATGVYWNRCYEPYAIAWDRGLKSDLTQAGLDVRSFNAALLHEPWEVQTGSGGPFKVYWPFWRACLRLSTGWSKPCRTRVLVLSLSKDGPGI